MDNVIAGFETKIYIKLVAKSVQLYNFIPFSLCIRKGDAGNTIIRLLLQDRMIFESANHEYPHRADRKFL